MPSKLLSKLCLSLCFLICLSLAACDLPSVSVTGAGTPVPTNSSSNGDTTLNTWLKTAPGVELRTEDWQGPSGNNDLITIVRLDPKHIKLRVAYQPKQPLLVSSWMKQEHATMIINGGYFDDQNVATGLVIANGQRYGASYDSFGGMLSVDNQGHIRLRSLSQHPFDPNEQLQQATQSAPMLILPGDKRTQFTANASSSRRTAVAVDKQGRLLFIVSPSLSFALDEFDDLLVASDLNIDSALNLDGGTSTGLFLNSGNQHVEIESVNPVPIAIIVDAH